MNYEQMANDIKEIVKGASEYLSEEKLGLLKADLEQAGLDHIQRSANHKQNKFSALLNNDK